MADTPSNNGAANAIATVNGKVEQAQGQAPEAQKPVQDEASKAFALKERQLHQQRKALMAEKEALQKKIAEYETGYVPRNRLKEDPYGVLEESGVDYALLTEQLMNQPQDPASRAMMAKLKAMEAKMQEQQNMAAKQQEEQYNQALKQITNETKMLVDSDERFETIKAKGMEEAVVELIRETFESEGTLMDVEEAAQKIEDYLVEEGYSYAQLKKVQARLQPKSEEIAQQPQQTQQGQLKTLTNQIDAQPKTRLSEKERRERALAAFAGKLNN